MPGHPETLSEKSPSSPIADGTTNDNIVNNEYDITSTPNHHRPQINTTEKFGSTSSTIPSPNEFNKFYGVDGAPTSPSINPPNGFVNGNYTSYRFRSSRRMKNSANRAADPTTNGSRKRQRPQRFYLNNFRLPIYVQLCVVICILCGLCVMVVAVTTVCLPYYPFVSQLTTV